MKRLITIVILAAYATVLFGNCGNTPAKVTAVPTPMLYGDTSRTEVPFAKDPTVIRLGDTYYMYYTVKAYDKSRRPDEVAPLEDGYNTAIARSTDMIHWEYVCQLDLRDSEGGRIWGAVAPCVKIFDDVIHMFYQRVWAATGNSEIWHAVSSDGITFTNTVDEPVWIARTGWSITRAIDAEVYRVGDRMVLIYATRDPQNVIQMLGMADAPYGSDYAPDKWVNLTPDAPLLSPDYPWEMSCIEAPTVYERNGIWYMFYAGAYNHENQQIGLATSTDGYHYTRVEYDPENPGLFYRMGGPGEWNTAESGHPGVFVDNDEQVYLFYQGKAAQKGPRNNYLLSVLKLGF